MVTMDFGKRQTIAASPAKPGDLPHGLVELPIDQRGDLKKHAIEASQQHFADGLFIWGARRIGRVVDEDRDSVV